MEQTSTLTERIIDQVAPTLSDHARVLAEVSGRLASERDALLERWRGCLQEERAFPSLQQFGGSRAKLEEAAGVLLDGLAARDDPALRRYLQNLAQWRKTLRETGTDFADRTRMLETLRRALLPFLVKHFSAGPELQLVFAALDAHARAVVRVWAAAEIELAQARLTEGAHQRSVGRLTGGIAHSLNNLLAVIMGHAQLLEEQVRTDDARAELRTIQMTARAGAESLRRLQQYALARDGQPGARVDVNGIVEEVLQLTRFRWRDDATASGIVIDVVKDLAPVPPVQAHAARLREALVELIMNSIEAMPLGGLITLRTARVGEVVHLSVTDLGGGMDETTQARAQEPFFTTKGTGHTGLGLTSVATIVEQQGGVLSLESRVGQGTTATISLAVAPSTKETTEPRLARLARWASILVVDDDNLVREVVVRALYARGFRAAAAESGADALRLYQAEGPFEVALVDLGMPEMNGFELARELKKLNPRTVIILITGWAAELDPRKMREAGIDRAVTKPFDVGQVIQLIGEAMAIREKL